jgi:tRNA A-37 threonylcarbamoyl transferase component Bud32
MTLIAINTMSEPGIVPLERLIDCVRRGLHLDRSVPVSINEVNKHSNINYVFRVELSQKRSLYLKVVPEWPKRLSARLPRERVFSEAEGLRRFRAVAGNTVKIPAVLFVDEQEMALAMEDVGGGRQVLFDILPDNFQLLTEQAERIGNALGSVHAATHNGVPLRPAPEEAVIRTVIFDGLLAPGARQLFPDTWNSLNVEMQAHRECLIHADLWSKNLLVRSRTPVALVDFEGVCCGDPAFDLATLSAVSLISAFEKPARLSEALNFIFRLWSAWVTTCGSNTWPREVLPRMLRSTACFLASRVCGPFAYELAEDARQRIVQLARILADEAMEDFEAFSSHVYKASGLSPLSTEITNS